MAARQNPSRRVEPSPPPAGRSTVTGRLFRAAFPLYLIAATVITGVLIAATYFFARSDLEHELTLHQRMLELTLSRPLRALDLDRVGQIATAAVEQGEITGIQVLDRNQEDELARVGDLPEDGTGGAAPGTQALPGQGITVSFPVDYSDAAGSTGVGYVTLFSSERVILERSRWQIALLVIAALLQTAILWIIFHRVSRSTLGRPLHRLVEATGRAGVGKLEPIAFDPATSKAAAGTEIETLRTAFNDVIGQLRRSRHALSLLNADLETRVAERTRDLEARSSEASAATARVEQSRRQVAAALEEAERAARTKSEFLALVSHELRTPLNSVLGFSELIQRQVDTRQDDMQPAQIASYADAIHESGTQLLTLVNDILDLSRIEAGRMEVAPEWIDTAATTRTVVEMMRDPATKQRLSIECQMDAATPMLKVDPRRYRQMLMNLLSNALKYTGAGGSIRVDGARRPDGWLEIVVADTGVGMPASDIAIALEPFGRTGDPTTRRLSGAGLGLPLVARMMQLHGGRLAIESAVNAGTRVILRFPPICVWDE